MAPDGSVGDVLLRNDNRANPRSLCSHIQGNLPAGRYGVLVSGKNDGAIPAYVVDFAVWQSIVATGDYAGAYENSGNDVYRLDRETRGQVILTTSNGMDACPIGTDTTLTLFQFRDGVIGDTVIQNGDGGPGVCSSVNIQLEPGSYIAVVSGFLGGRSSGYTLSARFIEVEPNFRPIRIENAGVDAPSARFRATCMIRGLNVLQKERMPTEMGARFIAR